MSTFESPLARSGEHILIVRDGSTYLNEARGKEPKPWSPCKILASASRTEVYHRAASSLLNVTCVSTEHTRTLRIVYGGTKVMAYDSSRPNFAIARIGPSLLFVSLPLTRKHVDFCFSRSRRCQERSRIRRSVVFIGKNTEVDSFFLEYRKYRRCSRRSKWCVFQRLKAPR